MGEPEVSQGDLAMKGLALATLMFFTAAVVAPATAAAQAPASPLTIPITGAGSGAVFSGTFQLQRFATDQGQLVATGLLTGVVTTTTGVTTSVARTVSIPAAVVNPTCQILHLDLGPLNLDVLGLVIDLNRVILDITAEAGAGNLLGNLLCAVTNLLNNPSGLATLLNRILALIG
jgi:hypothetical protein